MSKNRLENLPRPSTIARHYSEGKYVDYPADIILSAVNSQENLYNPTAIPIKLGFRHYFHGNTDAFLYLIEHNSPSEINAFLAEPNVYMTNAGISLALPFDKISPKIFAALAEDEIVDVLRNPDMEAVFKIVRRQDDKKWVLRHPERYPEDYMNRELPYGLQDIPYSIREIFSVKNGFSEHFNLCILVLSHYFCGEYDD